LSTHKVKIHVACVYQYPYDCWVKKKRSRRSRITDGELQRLFESWGQKA